jgi:hypothetical protein
MVVIPDSASFLRSHFWRKHHDLEPAARRLNPDQAIAISYTSRFRRKNSQIRLRIQRKISGKAN